MLSPRLVISLVAVAVVTVSAGWMHGSLTRRWGPPEDLVARGRKLEQFPRDIGPWKLQEAEELDTYVQKTLECSGAVKRTYVHAETGQVARVAVLCGPSGPISVHSPEICYSSQAFSIRSNEKVALETAPGRVDEFWCLTYNSKHVAGQFMRVYYAWTTGGPWQAADWARFEYGGQPYLYKIQVATDLTVAQAKTDTDAAKEFLREIVPVLNQYLANP